MTDDLESASPPDGEGQRSDHELGFDILMQALTEAPSVPVTRTPELQRAYDAGWELARTAQAQRAKDSNGRIQRGDP